MRVLHALHPATEPRRWTTAAAAAVTALGLGVGHPALAATAPTSSELFTYTDPRIDESSGIAASSFDDTFYAHNDSGDSARFFRVNARGNTVAVYTLRGASNVDWEDMATGLDDAGEPVLYLGDIGDNDHTRKEIAVYVVPEPHGASADVAWHRYRFSYPDGAHDAEGLLVDPRSHRIYIATKELLGNGTLYEAPAALSKAGINLLTAVGSVPPLTTSADFAPDGSHVVVLTYVAAFWADDVGGAWKHFDLPLPHQAEAIAYTRDGSSVLVGGEGAHSVVYLARAPGLVPGSASPTAPSSVQPTPSPPANAHKSHSRSAIEAGLLAVVGVLLVAGIYAVRRTRNR